jgi:hypothetical protein
MYLGKKKSAPLNAKAQQLSRTTEHSTTTTIPTIPSSSLCKSRNIFWTSSSLSLPHPSQSGLHYQTSSFSLASSSRFAAFLPSSVTSTHLSTRPPSQEDSLTSHSCPWCPSSRSPPPAVPAAASPYPIPGPILPHLSYDRPGLVPSSAHLQPIRAGFVLSHSDPQPRDYLQSITAQHVSRPSRRARRRRV